MWCIIMSSIDVLISKVLLFECRLSLGPDVCIDIAKNIFEFNFIDSLAFSYIICEYL